MPIRTVTNRNTFLKRYKRHVLVLLEEGVSRSVCSHHIMDKVHFVRHSDNILWSLVRRLCYQLKGDNINYFAIIYLKTCTDLYL